MLRISILYFEESPSLKKYKEIKKIAEKLHKWNSIRERLIKAAHSNELVKIYLFEKEYDKAFQKVISENKRFSDRLRDKVASALMKENPENALKIYLPIVQEFIYMAKRDSYRIAALYTKKSEGNIFSTGPRRGVERVHCSNPYGE